MAIEYCERECELLSFYTTGTLARNSGVSKIKTSDIKPRMDTNIVNDGLSAPYGLGS